MPLPARIQLFVTCIVDSLFPQAGEAVVEVLERLGMRVDFPLGQTCCGQPAYNAGFRAEARQLALRFLDAFEGSDAPVVTPSGSCAAMIVHGFPDLFRDQPAELARARALAARTYEFSQFLIQGPGTEAVARLGARFPGRVTYHPSCHLLRGLGVRDAAPQLLAGVRDLEFAPLPEADECCGFGGVFAVKHGDLSAAMLERKVQNIRASRADWVVGCDMSCLMNIQGALSRDGLPVRCLHLAEVLAASGGA